MSDNMPTITTQDIHFSNSERYFRFFARVNEILRDNQHVYPAIAVTHFLVQLLTRKWRIFYYPL